MGSSLGVCAKMTSGLEFNTKNCLSLIICITNEIELVENPFKHTISICLRKKGVNQETSLLTP